MLKSIRIDVKKYDVTFNYIIVKFPYIF